MHDWENLKCSWIDLYIVWRSNTHPGRIAGFGHVIDLQGINRHVTNNINLLKMGNIDKQDDIAVVTSSKDLLMIVSTDGGGSWTCAFVKTCVLRNRCWSLLFLLFCWLIGRRRLTGIDYLPCPALVISCNVLVSISCYIMKDRCDSSCILVCCHFGVYHCTTKLWAAGMCTMKKMYIVHKKLRALRSNPVTRCSDAHYWSSAAVGITQAIRYKKLGFTFG